MRVLCFCALLAALASPAVGLAQGTGVVRGAVVDAGGKPLVGALVAVAGTTRGDVTDAEGWFRITGVPVGARAVRSTSAGYAESTRTVEVVAGDTARVLLRLTPSMSTSGPRVWPPDPGAERRAVPIVHPRAGD